MKKGGDGTHVLNSGDKGWNGERAQVVSMPRRERVQWRTSESGVMKRRVTTRRSRYVVLDEEDEEEEEEDQQKEIRKEELVGRKMRRNTTLEKTSDVADKGEASTMLESQEDNAGPSTTRPTSSQADPSIRTQADNLLRDAVDPNSVDDINIARLLGAAEVVGYPQSPRRTTSGQRSLVPEYESDYEQDGQRQSPLFVESDLDLEPEASVRDRQEQHPKRTSGTKNKGKGRQVQWQSTREEDDTHKDERSTLWE